MLKLPDLQARAIKIAYQELFRKNQNHAVGMTSEELHGGDALLLSKDGLVTGFSAWLAIAPTRNRGVAGLSGNAEMVEYAVSPDELQAFRVFPLCESDMVPP